MRPPNLFTKTDTKLYRITEDLEEKSKVSASVGAATESKTNYSVSNGNGFEQDLEEYTGSSAKNLDAVESITSYVDISEDPVQNEDSVSDSKLAGDLSTEADLSVADSPTDASLGENVELNTSSTSNENDVQNDLLSNSVEENGDSETKEVAGPSSTEAIKNVAGEDLNPDANDAEENWAAFKKNIFQPVLSLDDIGFSDLIAELDAYSAANSDTAGPVSETDVSDNGVTKAGELQTDLEAAGQDGNTDNKSVLDANDADDVESVSTSEIESSDTTDDVWDDWKFFAADSGEPEIVGPHDAEMESLFAPEIWSDVLNNEGRSSSSMAA